MMYLNRLLPFTMPKAIIILFLSVLFVNVASAQKKDSITYFMTNEDKIATSAGNADYVRIIYPPDSTFDKDLYIVRDFYINGKPKLIAKSYSKTQNLKLQGSYIDYFPNGRKKSMKSYEKGRLVDDAAEYYPNGKLYCLKKYSLKNEVTLLECRDTIGNILAKNSKGKWIIYDDDFKFLAKGSVENGRQEGEWTGIEINGDKRKGIFHNGVYTSGNLFVDNKKIYGSEIEVLPSFKDGDLGFVRFIAQMIHYPSMARRYDVQGRVIVSFVIEVDGSLNDIKVVKGIGGGCDEEAVRAIKLSPRWTPGTINGMPVRVKYNVPVQFVVR
jgi:TonB family protein